MDIISPNTSRSAPRPIPKNAAWVSGLNLQVTAARATAVARRTVSNAYAAPSLFLVGAGFPVAPAVLGGFVGAALSTPISTAPSSPVERRPVIAGGRYVSEG